jgi:hypothetical protein
MAMRAAMRSGTRESVGSDGLTSFIDCRGELVMCDGADHTKTESRVATDKKRIFYTWVQYDHTVKFGRKQVKVSGSAATAGGRPGSRWPHHDDDCILCSSETCKSRRVIWSGRRLELKSVEHHLLTISNASTTVSSLSDLSDMRPAWPCARIV